MAYPESHGSCGGNVGERMIPLIKASSMGFSVLYNSGLAERINAISPNAVKNKISVVMTIGDCDLRKPRISSLCFVYDHTTRPIKKARASSMPPASFWAKPSDASSQKTYPQINNPTVRENINPRSASAGRSRNASGKVNQPSALTSRYQRRNEIMAGEGKMFRKQDQLQSPKQRRRHPD